MLDFEDLTRTQAYRWLNAIPPGPEILMHTRRLFWCLPWWKGLPGYLDWVEDIRENPRIGFIPIVRTQQDVDAVVALREARFPMRKLVLQCFPEERLVIPPADAVWVGSIQNCWRTPTPMREEWIQDLRDQAVPGTFAFLSRCGWWPERLGGKAWAKRFGHLRGPVIPPIDESEAGTYPSWVVKDEGNP